MPTACTSGLTMATRGRQQDEMRSSEDALRSPVDGVHTLQASKSATERGELSVPPVEVALGDIEVTPCRKNRKLFTHKAL